MSFKHISKDELQFSNYAEYLDTHEELSDDGRILVVGYLVQDSSMENPLKNDDAYGTIYTTERFSRTKGDAMAAMGFNSDGGKDLDAVWYAHREEAIKLYVEAVFADEDPEQLRQWAIQRNSDNCRRRGKKYIAEELKADADYWDEYGNLAHYDRMQEVLESMWEKPEFYPGDVNAVVLDCYSHSGEHWSLSGGGMQCRWDTASGAGVWVPNDICLAEINRRGPVYETHWVEDTSYILGTGKQYQLNGPEGHIAFSDDWYELFCKAVELAGPNPVMGDLGRTRACEQLAQQAVDMLNAYCSGDCYGVVTEVFVRDDEDSDWEQVEEDSCWGFWLGEYAEQELKDEFDEALAQSRQKAFHYLNPPDPNQLSLIPT